MEAQEFRGKRKLPENLSIFPYVEEFGEYAAAVRQEILRRRETDFILAVDLPAGLEESLLDAVRKLPRPSVVALPDRRAIPVLPSSAPIEAVRSFLEYGLDLVFIDTPVPVLGTVEGYRLFANACSHFGCHTVYNQLKQFGFALPTGDVIDPSETSPYELYRPFGQMVAAIERRVASTGSFEELPLSMQTRVQFMAYRLRPLLARGIDVVLVCSAPLVAGVVACLGRDLPWFPDDLRVPTDTFRLAASEIPAMTREIPYFIWLYEVNRDQDPDRHAWLGQIYRESADGHDITTRRLIQTVQYAERLALTDGQLGPGLRDLVLAAGCVVDPAYAGEVLERALSYPPAYDEDHDPVPPLLNLQTGAVLGDAQATAELTSRFDPGVTDASPAEAQVIPWVPFFRSRESIENEVAFIQYLTGHFTARRASTSETETREFTSGFGEGLDLREMLRDGTDSTIYVREAVMEHAASFVLDLREECLARVAEAAGPDADVHDEFLRSATHLTVEHGYPGVGLCFDEDVRLTPYVLVTLPMATRPLRELCLELSKRRPLRSAVTVALDQSPFAFVFTDYPQEIVCTAADRGRLRVLPLETIPGTQRQRIVNFCKGARGVKPHVD